jgi:hypothetical protein
MARRFEIRVSVAEDERGTRVAANNWADSYQFPTITGACDWVAAELAMAVQGEKVSAKNLAKFGGQIIECPF